MSEHPERHYSKLTTRRFPARKRRTQGDDSEWSIWALARPPECMWQVTQDGIHVMLEHHAGIGETERCPYKLIHGNCVLMALFSTAHASRAATGNGR
jgi:hypothetical protein